MLVTKMSRKDKETLKAASFGFSQLFFTFCLIILCLSSVDRVVLGTELNGDGSVEYLCLGSSCESLTKMDWQPHPMFVCIYAIISVLIGLSSNLGLLPLEFGKVNIFERLILVAFCALFWPALLLVCLRWTLKKEPELQAASEKVVDITVIFEFTQRDLLKSGVVLFG